MRMAVKTLIFAKSPDNWSVSLRNCDIDRFNLKGGASQKASYPMRLWSFPNIKEVTLR
jgi:hypothetical protein